MPMLKFLKKLYSSKPADNKAWIDKTGKITMNKKTFENFSKLSEILRGKNPHYSVLICHVLSTESTQKKLYEFKLKKLEPVKTEDFKKIFEKVIENKNLISTADINDLEKANRDNCVFIENTDKINRTATTKNNMQIPNLISKESNREILFTMKLNNKIYTSVYYKETVADAFDDASSYLEEVPGN